VNYKYDIVVQIGSPPQFFGVENLIEELVKRKITYTCFVPVVNDEYSKEMFDLTYDLVVKSGFKVVRAAPVSCKVFLAAWPRGDTKYKYILRYTYSLLTAKPNPVYLPDSQRRYHGILSQNTQEYETLKVYATTYFVPNLKYVGWKKQPTNGRNILFLPTWNMDALGDVGKINSNREIIPALKKLKQNGYRIIIKAHPLTISDPAAIREGEDLRKIADEYIRPDIGIQDVLAAADLVISDNSGAIYEALYTDIPVVVYGDKTNKRHLGSIDTAHHRWIEDGIIDNPKNPSQLLPSVQRALEKSYIKKQQTVSDATFKKVYDKSAVSRWMEVIDRYLRDEVSQDYVELHNQYMSFIDKKDQRITNLEDEISRIKSQADALASTVSLEQNPGIKTATKRLIKAVSIKLGFVRRRL
jgi:CDP-glycerol glycerophosphotransferase (TagB/SpsB family)